MEEKEEKQPKKHRLPDLTPTLAWKKEKEVVEKETPLPPKIGREEEAGVIKD